MKKSVVLSMALASLIGSMAAQDAVAAPANATVAPSIAEIQKIQRQQSILLDAHLAGMKAGLKLSEEQARYWPSFEAAIRDAAKARSDRWLEARERMNSSVRPSPIDRISIMADHIEKSAVELRKVVDAGKPLYDSLNDAQKAEFGPLMREFKPRKRF